MHGLVNTYVRTGQHLASWVVWHATHVSLVPDLDEKAQPRTAKSRSNTGRSHKKAA